MRPSQPSHNWSETARDQHGASVYITWRCRGCRAWAVTAQHQNTHPGACLRCQSKAGK